MKNDFCRLPLGEIIVINQWSIANVNSLISIAHSKNEKKKIETL